MKALSRVAWWVSPPAIRFVARIAWRLRIEGRFPEPPFVIAANHHSFLDPPLVGAAYGRRLRFLALSDLFGNYRLLDLALNAFEVILVRRGTVPLRVVRQALEQLHGGGVVGVFPEGTRSPRFGDKPWASGAAWLAVRTKVPLVPVAITGTDRVLGVDNRLRPGRIRVVVGPPLRPGGGGRSEVDDLIGRWVQWISAQLPAGAP